ncbi:serine hydrolase domain-containing protein [Pedobacter gandavensis]|nr:serine hydrolase domain-containing protein [Pedobacter gandavensis]
MDMIFKKPILSLILLVTSILPSSVALAKVLQLTPTLKNIAGYYQHPQVKELYLQMKISGNKLKQIRDWDGRELLLDPKSETEFSSPNGDYNLHFLKDGNNEISAVKIGQELWVKVAGYRPEKMPGLTVAQVSALLNEKAEKLVAAINANTDKRLVDYVNNNFSKKLKSTTQGDFLSRAKAAYRSTAGVKFDKRLYFNANALFAEYQYASADLNNVLEFSLKLDQKGKIKLYNSRVTYSQDPIKKLNTEQELIGDLDQTLKHLSQKDVFSGAVLFAKGDRVLYEYSTGLAIKKDGIKNNIDTKFNIGSINKMFTAVGVMQLVEQGKLNLNDPLSKFLDSTWIPTALADQIKVSQLLNHTAGVGDFFSEKMQAAPLSQFRTLEGYKPFVKLTKLEFEPGTSWSYSNSGMLLLGLIIEKVSGQNYFDYVKEHIYKIAGMESSAMRTFGGKEPGEPVEAQENKYLSNQAMGYIPTIDNTYILASSPIYTIGSAAGGGYSTVGDLHKFGIALLSGQLLSDSSRLKMFKDELGIGYGYGFQLSGSPKLEVVGHSGGAPGVNAVSYYFPETGYMIVVLSNYDRGAADLGEYMLNQVKSIVK